MIRNLLKLFILSSLRFQIDLLKKKCKKRADKVSCVQIHISYYLETQTISINGTESNITNKPLLIYANILYMNDFRILLVKGNSCLPVADQYINELFVHRPATNFEQGLWMLFFIIRFHYHYHRLFI